MPRSDVVQQIVRRFRITVTIFAAIQPTMNQHVPFQRSNRLHFNITDKVYLRCVSVCDEQECLMFSIYNHTNCKNKVYLRAGVCLFVTSKSA